jgi:hypothetical protein
MTTNILSVTNPLNGVLFSMALPVHSGPRSLIQFRNHFSQTVGLLGRVISPSQGRYLNTGRHKHRINSYTHQTSLPWVGFEPTIPASERAKTVHALGRGHTKETGNRNATAISENCYQPELKICYWMELRKLRKRLRICLIYMRYTARIYSNAHRISARQRLGKHLFSRQRMLTKAFSWQHSRTEELSFCAST